MNRELTHHGIKGQKWGVRRFQTKDGGLTPAGRKRYSDSGGISGAIRRKQMSNVQRDLDDIQKRKKQVDSELRELRGYEKNASGLAASKVSTAIRRNQIESLEKTRADLDSRERDNRDALRELDKIEKHKQAKKDLRNSEEAKVIRKEKAVKAAKVGAAVAGAALAAYGTYRIHKFIRDENTKIHVERGKKEADELLKKAKFMVSDDYDGRYGVVFSYDKENLKKHIAKTTLEYDAKAQHLARKDSFKGATQNVVDHYRKKLKK